MKEVLMVVGILFIFCSFIPFVKGQIMPPEEYLEPISFIGVLSQLPTYEIHIWLDNYRDVAGTFDNYDLTILNKKDNLTIRIFVGWKEIWDFYWSGDNYTYTQEFRADRPLEFNFELPVKDRIEKVTYYIDPKYHHITIQQYWFVNPMIGSIYGRVSPNLENANIIQQSPSNVIIVYENGQRYFRFVESEVMVGLQFVKSGNMMTSLPLGYGHPLLPHYGEGEVENFILYGKTLYYGITGKWRVGDGILELGYLFIDNNYLMKKIKDNIVIYGYDDIGYVVGTFEKNNEGFGLILINPITATAVFIKEEVYSEGLWDYIWWWITEKSMYFSLFVVGCLTITVGYIVERKERMVRIGR